MLTQVVQMSPPMITDVRVDKGRGKLLDSAAFPEGSIFTITAVTQMFDITPRTLYNELSEKRDLFDPPMYRVRFDKRRRRYLSARDLNVLRDIFRVRVKKK